MHPPLSDKRRAAAARLRRRCVLVTSRSLRRTSDLLPAHRGRASRVHALIRALGLAQRFSVHEPPLASPEELMRFHSREYLALLRSSDPRPHDRADEEACACLMGDADGSDSGSDEDEEEEGEGGGDAGDGGASTLELYGLTGDCEPFPGVWQHSRAVAGAALCAARRLVAASNERDDARSRWRAAQKRLRAAGVACAPPEDSEEEEEDSEEEEEEEEAADAEAAAAGGDEATVLPHGAERPPPLPPGGRQPQPPPPRAPLAVCWTGGRHHAQADKAAGFCYVNDIVLAILEILRSSTDARVLYIDVDVHHGDGVAAAFASSDRVLTLSLHHHARGFFPGSGAASEVGIGRGKHHDVNVALRRGVSDATFTALFERTTSMLERAYRPTHVVWQCGADALAWDPQAVFNLTPMVFGALAAHVRSFDIPLLVLGGGGYHVTQTARAWAFATAALVEGPFGDTRLDPDAELPEHEYYAEYISARGRSEGELVDEDDEKAGAAGRGSVYDNAMALRGGDSALFGSGGGGFGFMLRTRPVSSITRPDEEAGEGRIDELMETVAAAAERIEQRRLRRGGR